MPKPAYLIHMITPEQSRAARAWLDWSQEQLAEKAGVALSTIRDFEKGRRTPIGNNLSAIEAALRSAGMALVSYEGEPAGVRYEGRLKERDTYIPMLELLDDAPDGFLPTSDLIRALEMMLNPRGEDAQILANRSDTRFSRIVRNIVSHRESPNNPIHEGWVEYEKTKRGLKITPQGRRYLVAEQDRRST